MKYNEYKKGYSALRRIINDEELEFSGQFVKFDFSFSERYQNNRAIRGIWNARTNNVVAFINKKGNVFVRPASVYTEHLLGSKNKVIKQSVIAQALGHIWRNLSATEKAKYKSGSPVISRGAEPRGAESLGGGYDDYEEQYGGRHQGYNRYGRYAY